MATKIINKIFKESVNRDLDRALTDIAKSAAQGNKPAIVTDLFNRNTIKALENEGFQIAEKFIDGVGWFEVDWDSQKINNQLINIKQLK